MHVISLIGYGEVAASGEYVVGTSDFPTDHEKVVTLFRLDVENLQILLF